ncbi:MAG: hypothetical protein MZW92_42780 [Comamonadaceae bacterium]|nr:hypothetical protein [Comamonadaceae bacterium]
MQARRRRGGRVPRSATPVHRGGRAGRLSGGARGPRGHPRRRGQPRAPGGRNLRDQCAGSGPAAHPERNRPGVQANGAWPWSGRCGCRARPASTSNWASQELSQAQIVHGDAMHEAGRTLLKAWFAWQREVAQTRQWQAQVEVLKEQAAVAAKRVRAGDASGLEKSLAEASLAQAEASLAQSRGRERVAASDLAVRFARVPCRPSR